MLYIQVASLTIRRNFNLYHIRAGVSVLAHLASWSLTCRLHTSTVHHSPSLPPPLLAIKPGPECLQEYWKCWTQSCSWQTRKICPVYESRLSLWDDQWLTVPPHFPLKVRLLHLPLPHKQVSNLEHYSIIMTKLHSSFCHDAKISFTRHISGKRIPCCNIVSQD